MIGKCADRCFGEGVSGVSLEERKGRLIKRWEGPGGGELGFGVRPEGGESGESRVEMALTDLRFEVGPD